MAIFSRCMGWVNHLFCITMAELYGETKAVTPLPSAYGDEQNTSIVIGPWGGSGGNPFDHGNNYDVKEITIVHGNTVNSISVVYDKESSEPVLTEKQIGSGVHTSTVKLEAKEYLKGVRGQYAAFDGLSSVIRTLTFETNLRTYGPFGSGSGTAFSVPIEQGKITGFKGRSGKYLEQIAVYISPIN